MIRSGPEEGEMRRQCGEGLGDGGWKGGEAGADVRGGR